MITNYDDRFVMKNVIHKILYIKVMSITRVFNFSIKFFLATLKTIEIYELG